MKKIFLSFVFISIFINLFSNGLFEHSFSTKSKGELNIYACCDEKNLAAVCKKFEKTYGIKTNYQIFSSIEAFTQIKAEKDAPNADIWFCGTTDLFNTAASEGLLLPYEAENAKYLVNKIYKDSKNRWHGVYLSILGFYWNSSELRRLKITEPKDWEDLLDPKYQGLISFGTPDLTETGRIIVNTIVQQRGIDAAMEYLKKLHKNVAFYTKTSEESAKLLATGEAVIGIGFLHDALREIVDFNYENIELAIPYSGTSFEIEPVAILKNCSNEENAKKFVEFALSSACVSLAQKNGSYQLLVLNNAPTVKKAKYAGIEKSNYIGYDFEDARLNGNDYCKLFFEAIKE